MADMTLDEVYRAAIRLTPEEQEALVARLQAERGRSGKVTRASILAEFDRRKAAGAFDNLESLKGKFARPGPLPDADEVEAYLRSLGTEWEEDLDDIAG